MNARIIFKVVIVACLTGCATTDPLQENYEAPGQLPRSYLEQFCYRATPVIDELTLIKEKKSYNLFEVSMEAGLNGSDDNTPITFEYYEPVRDAPSPVVLLLPILNGQQHILRPFASHFVKNGYAVILVDTVQRKTLLKDLVDPEPAIQQTVQRHRRIIDWAETQPKLDVSRLGVFGASLGGFNALFLAALDDRVSVAAPALVGGSLPYVLVTSTEGRIEEAVAETKEKLSFDDEQLMSYLAKKIQTDPLTLAPHLNADRVLLTLARFDKAVPYDRQVELRDVMGHPESVTLPTGHYTAGLYVFSLRSRVRKFFDRKLAEPGEHGTAVMPAEFCSPS